MGGLSTLKEIRSRLGTKRTSISGSRLKTVGILQYTRLGEDAYENYVVDRRASRPTLASQTQASETLARRTCSTTRVRARSLQALRNDDGGGDGGHRPNAVNFSLSPLKTLN